MSKGSFILQGTTGKVGPLVVQRRKGKTILKEYVVPANPKTAMQNAQRIVFATVQQAAKFMKPIIDHSFEGVARGGDSVNRFAKVNLERLRAYSALDYQNSASYADAKCFMTTKRVSALIPNAYIMAQGSLVLDPKSANYIDASEGEVYPFNPANAIQDSTAGVTLGQALNALFGFTRPGQQLTKCYIICHSGQGYNIYEYGGVPTVPGTVIPSFKFLAARLVLRDAINWDQDVHASWANLKTLIRDCFDLEKSDATLLQAVIDGITNDENAYNLSGLETLLNLNFGLDGFVAAECTILSELYGSGWLRSNAEMALVKVPDPDDNYGLTWYEAQKAWIEGSVNADNERFLNEGGDQNQVGF